MIIMPEKREERVAGPTLGPLVSCTSALLDAALFTGSMAGWWFHMLVRVASALFS